jgi:hypothetical protein
MSRGGLSRDAREGGVQTRELKQQAMAEKKKRALKLFANDAELSSNLIAHRLSMSAAVVNRWRTEWRKTRRPS